MASLSAEIGSLSAAQAGFRNSHSTADNIFILHSLINLYLSKKKKLFCTFIDLSRAFDTIWRVGLWQKLIENNISGKCFNVIKSLYQNVKSCVTKICQKSDYFACNVGVRQFENLPPFSFSLFINDIEQYLEDNGVESLAMINEVSFEVLDIYLKIFLLLYADTVLMSENVDGMQTMLNVFSEYCNTWKLQVNVTKTKVVIFSKRRVSQNTRFMSDNKELDICESYNYLGILFHFNNNFVNAKKKLVEQAQHTLFSVYYKIRNIKIPLDLQWKIFDTLVFPILLYACEVIGFDKNDNIEKVHLQSLKNILRVRTITPNHLVYGELGRFPLVIDIKCRMLTFWNKLISSNKLSSKIARLLYTLNINETQGFKWI